MNDLIQYVLFVFIVIAFVTDARKFVIPNWLTVSGAIAGAAFHTLSAGVAGLIHSCLGAAAGFGILLLLYLVGAVGAGDVKLFAAIGAMTGCLFVLQSTLYSIFFAGVIGIGLLLARKKLLVTGNRIAGWLIAVAVHKDMETALGMKQQTNMKFPFMYAVVPGVLSAWHYSFM